MRNDIEKRIRAFHEPMTVDRNHRYLSWEHCYSYFQAEKTIDKRTGCLHLAFYLASWGMYRGSSFLLWKDYLIHLPVVETILQERYRDLYRLDFDKLTEFDHELDLMLELVKDIRAVYNQIQRVNGEKREVLASDTLITKIILGTIGCLPAYDRYVTCGMRCLGVPFSSINRKHLTHLLGFYQENTAAFRSAQKAVSRSGLKYPPMKLVDMYFWMVGNDEQSSKIK